MLWSCYLLHCSPFGMISSRLLYDTTNMILWFVLMLFIFSFPSANNSKLSYILLNAFLSFLLFAALFSLHYEILFLSFLSPADVIICRVLLIYSIFLFLQQIILSVYIFFSSRYCSYYQLHCSLSISIFWFRFSLLSIQDFTHGKEFQTLVVIIFASFVLTLRCCHRSFTFSLMSNAYSYFFSP